MSECRVTVFTAVYNRRHTIHRTFEGLMAQTCTDFEWLVIDDGSTDNVKELIDEYAKKAPFEVRYYYKENGGKHTAHNMGLKYARGEYFLSIDSDDALAPTAVEKSLEVWDSIPEDKRDMFWCVTGRCIDADTGEMIGPLFPEDINDSPNPAAVAAQVPGEKTGCSSTAKLREFPFPEPKGTTFITESVVWNKLDKKYKQYYCNEIFRYYYMNEPDSICNSWFRDHVEEGYVSNFYWKTATINDMGIRSMSDLKTLLVIPYYGLMADRSPKEIVTALDKKSYRFVTALFIPLGAFFKLVKGRKK